MFESTLKWTVLAASIVLISCPVSAVAETDADFFNGKTVNYIVATTPGGGYDYYGRLVAAYMQKHLPGSTFVVRNMPGAGHIIGASAIYAAEPDGLTIGTFNTGLIYAQLADTSGMKVDLTKMSWLGKASSDPRAIIVSKLSPFNSFQDLQASGDIVFSTSGVGSAGYAESKLLSDALHLPISLISGYNGNDDQLAMRRGEVSGTINTRSSWEHFVKDGYGRFIAQIGGHQTDVPQIASFVKGDDAEAVVALIQSQGEIQRLTAGPPGIPAGRLEVLRNAYKAALEDKELQEKAARADYPIEPLYGADVEKLVKLALTQSPRTISLLKSALTDGGTASMLKATGPILNIEGGKKITFTDAEGNPMSMDVSGSRTDVKISGVKAERSELKVGQVCEISYVANASEATSIVCQ